MKDNSTFENIKQIDEYGKEYWLARELQKVLEYKEWRNFKVVIDKAIVSCENSKINVFDHFVEVNKMIELGKNYTLQKVASAAGVKNMSEFHNAGYRGLYNGETADDIFKRKKLRYREDILDNMNEDELVANLFRINQTKQKLIKDKVQGEKEAKDVHYDVGKKVRKAIADIGGTMPEDMPTPEKSLKELEKEKKQLENKENKKLEAVK